MPDIPAEVLRHYEDLRPESTRITEGWGSLELVRTQEIVRRHLPAAPARVLDVGGGEGAHARWLTADGYDVDLVDPVPAHVEAAHAHGVRASIGDARALDARDGSYDAVLVLGPCYHLTERADRVRALREAHRVVRADGVVFVAAISRFASLFEGLAHGILFDPTFRAIVEQDLATGRHRNPDPDAHPEWFTTAYFHRPEELAAEASDAGLWVREVVGVEGMAHWVHPLREHWHDPNDREVILDAARAIETEPALAGLSPHLLLVATPR